MYAKWLQRFINLLFIMLLTSLLGAAALPTPTEYQVKAVYLFNFSKLMTWPRLMSPKTSIQICVLGDNPFDNFDNFLKDKKIGERTVKLTHFSNFWYDLTKTNTCQILFISQSETKNLTTILAYIRQYPILTVSDMDDFVMQGGMIQFYNRGNTVRFLFDPQTVDEVGILVSELIFS